MLNYVKRLECKLLLPVVKTVFALFKYLLHNKSPIWKTFLFLTITIKSAGWEGNFNGQKIVVSKKMFQKIIKKKNVVGKCFYG